MISIWFYVIRALHALRLVEMARLGGNMVNKG